MDPARSNVLPSNVPATSTVTTMVSSAVSGLPRAVLESVWTEWQGLGLDEALLQDLAVAMLS